MTTSDEIRNIAVVGHKGAGKTALIEAMLFMARAIPKIAKAPEYVGGLDDSPEEKAHESTLESRVETIRYGGKKINVVDTPGDPSFGGDTRMALAAVDAAVMVVSAKDGVQTGTERSFRWIRDSKMPCLVVITKDDDENAHPGEVLEELRARLKVPFAQMELIDGEGHDFHGVVALRSGKAWIGGAESPTTAPDAVPAAMSKAVSEARGKLVDEVASTDDSLTEKYLTDGDLSQADLDEGARKAILTGKLWPVYYVTSTTPHGVLALLDGIADLLPSPSARPPWKGASGSFGGAAERAPVATEPVSAFIFKTHIDPHAGRQSFVRVLSGVLHPDSQLFHPQSGQRERVGQIVQGVGKDLKPLGEAPAGDIVVLPKLKAARTGDTLCDEKSPFALERPAVPPPLFSRTLVLDGKGAEDKVATQLARLVEEDPGLAYHNDELSRAILIEGIGASHLEITVERIKRRSGIDCKLGPPKIPYRETISKKVTAIEGKQKKQSGGHGQFGVCYVDVEPLPRGSGFVFEDAIVGGSIPRQFIPSVEKGIARAMVRGTLAGYPVVDVKVRLYDGKYHSVDSSDAAFQVAGMRAFRAAMEKAGVMLLEPYARLDIRIPGEMMGDVIGDLNSRHGKVLGTDQDGDATVITALVPLAATLDYEPKLTSLTSGRGTFTLTPDRYDPCSPQTQEKVVKESGFKIVDEE